MITASATSSGFPTLLSGIFSETKEIIVSYLSFNKLRTTGVSIQPQETALTRIGANSTAKQRVNVLAAATPTAAIVMPGIG